MFTSIRARLLVLPFLCLSLTACESKEDRAEGYYQSSLSLLEEGDTDRAIVELRNVFELNPSHRDARATLAEIYLADGNIQGAYGQYLRLVEQYPEDVEGRIKLSEMSFGIGNWDEFERHAAVAAELAAEEPRVQAITLGQQYRAAVLGKDELAREALQPKAEALLVELPDNTILNSLLLDSFVRSNAFDKALERMDALIASDPTRRESYDQRLQLLARMEDAPAIEAQLREMVTLFPDDDEIKYMVVRYYIAQNQTSDAEAFLREVADPADEDPTLFVAFIGFLSDTKGAAAARVEIERAVALNPNPVRFQALLALMDFQEGKRDEAVAALEAILARPEDLGEDGQNVKIILSRMQETMGNTVGARRLIEEVLAENPRQVDALKMQATWQIQSDDTDAAIANLRIALDVAPEDVQAMNLMAQAYERSGSHELARDFLALAVDASGNAPEPSLRYARLLMQEERYLPAEDILVTALRQTPGNLGILVTLGQIYVQMEDTARATQVVDTLRRMETEEATAASNQLQTAILNLTSGADEAMGFLEQLATGENADIRQKLALLQAKFRQGDLEEALTMAQTLVAENPGDRPLQYALAIAQSANGDLETAEATLRAVLATGPGSPQIWLALTRILERQGDSAGADAALADGLAALPDEPNLLWARASTLERTGDIDGAIDIYQGLYAKMSDSIIIANNLASLLATYRTDDASLEQAWTIARRLRDTEVPAFQDTYGWIAFRRGDAAEALPYLEGAAAGLDSDPIVQFHLAQVYEALGRTSDALRQLEKTIQIAGPTDTRPQIEQARTDVIRLREAAKN